MKRCPRCGQTYFEGDLNFCLDDGELLAFVPEAERERFSGDAPPTVILDAPRPTNQQWQAAQPPAHWQNSPPPAPVYTGGFYSGVHHHNQTLPTISLVLGIISCFMVCCAGGIWLGLPAAVLGYLGMQNADRDPDHYSGRGMAIAGLILGIVTFLFSLGMMIIGGIR